MTEISIEQKIKEREEKNELTIFQNSYNENERYEVDNNKAPVRGDKVISIFENHVSESDDESVYLFSEEPYIFIEEENGEVFIAEKDFYENNSKEKIDKRVHYDKKIRFPGAYTYTDESEFSIKQQKEFSRNKKIYEEAKKAFEEAMKGVVLITDIKDIKVIK